MRTFIHRRLTYANVMATIAVFMAMAGSGLAAKSYVVSSTKQIKNGAVRGADVRNSSLTGSDVKNSSLTGSDVKNSSLTGADIDLAALGKVPAAATADDAKTATNATNALHADRARVSDQVDGQHVERLSAAVAPGTTVNVAAADSELELLATCTDQGELVLQAASKTEHALVRATVISAFTPPAEVSVVDDSDLNPGEMLTIFNAHGRGTAQIAYRSAQDLVSTAVIGFGELTGPQSCTVTGTLVRAG